ncbi:MAG TPA: ammonium transporter [Dehalococcoidia bacterium]|nr:ammonium transporter [Dehalococcoidia bacterium]
MVERIFWMRRPLAVVGGALLALALFSTVGAREEADPVEELAGAIDTAWLMIAAFLVFFMQAGFAMVEAGFVRAKNTTNILMKNILDASIGAIAFWAVGWGIAYGVSGESAPGLIGDGQFFLRGFDDYASWIFQFAFAATAATIVSGAMAERTKFTAYLVYTVFITAFIYPVVVHWAWDANGWMSTFNADPGLPGNGYMDFAGSGVVHAVGGIAGLMGAVIVGPRLGKFGKDGSINAIPGHNMSIAVLGMFILWFGWYGFNPGSTLGLSGGFAEIAARVAVMTTLAAGAGAVTTALASKALTGNYDMGFVVNGALGGLVAITAPCATVEPWAAIVIGCVGGLVVMGGIRVLESLRIDDPVGAVSVHGFAGIWGVLSLGLFSNQELMANAYGFESNYGLLLGGGVEQLAAQAIGVAAIVAWTAVTAGTVFLAIRYTIGLRVPEAEEIEGLDVGEHGMPAYPDFSPATGSGGAFGGIMTPMPTPASAPPRALPESGPAGAS